MRLWRSICVVLLTALLGGLVLPWLGADHQFNDDPHWAVALGAGTATEPRLDVDRPGDTEHCEVCHWFRTMRSAARPAKVTVFRDVRQVVPPATPDPRTRAVSAPVLGARAPPSFFL